MFDSQSHAIILQSFRVATIRVAIGGGGGNTTTMEEIPYDFLKEVLYHIA